MQHLLVWLLLLLMVLGSKLGTPADMLRGRLLLCTILLLPLLRRWSRWLRPVVAGLL